MKETGAMLRYSGGDARKLLNILELIVNSFSSDEIIITDEVVEGNSSKILLLMINREKCIMTLSLLSSRVSGEVILMLHYIGWQE